MVHGLLQDCALSPVLFAHTNEGACRPLKAELLHRGCVATCSHFVHDCTRARSVNDRARLLCLVFSFPESAPGPRHLVTRPFPLRLWLKRGAEKMAVDSIYCVDLKSGRMIAWDVVRIMAFVLMRIGAAASIAATVLSTYGGPHVLRHDRRCVRCAASRRPHHVADTRSMRRARP